jgi:hypothetical protein
VILSAISEQLRAIIDRNFSLYWKKIGVITPNWSGGINNWAVEIVIYGPENES